MLLIIYDNFKQLANQFYNNWSVVSIDLLSFFFMPFLYFGVYSPDQGNVTFILHCPIFEQL